MVLSRNSFFFALFILIISPFLLHKFVWLSGTVETTGVSSFIGKSIEGQIPFRYSVIMFTAGKDSLFVNTSANIFYDKGEKLSVRYRQDNPRDARVNDFAGIWGDTVSYSGVLLMILLISFFHPDLIPRGSRIVFKKTKPFIEVVQSS